MLVVFLIRGVRERQSSQCSAAARSPRRRSPSTSVVVTADDRTGDGITAWCH